MNRVLVTPRSLTQAGHPALHLLTEAGFDLIMPSPGVLPGQDVLLQLLPGCDGYLAGVEPIDATLLSNADRLKVISRNGIGVDNIDLEAAERHGIAVEVAPGANSRGVAELAVGLSLATLRGVVASDRVVKAGGLRRSMGRELTSITVGVVGLGAVGSIVASLFRSLGARVIAHDVVPRPCTGIEVQPLDSVLDEADIVTLHCPPRPDATPVLGAREIARLRRDAVIVNTARASLVDHAAVLAALDDDRLLAYATDVHDHEPHVHDRLLCHEKVVCTPHIGGLTAESVDRAATTAVKNLLKHLVGRT